MNLLKEDIYRTVKTIPLSIFCHGIGDVDDQHGENAGVANERNEVVFVNYEKRP